MMNPATQGMDDRPHLGLSTAKGRVPNQRTNAERRLALHHYPDLPLWWRLLNLAFRNVS
jgi:hypothetical protein